MAWTNSKVGRQTLADILGNTTALDLNSDTFKGALYNNTPTPDNDVTAANFAYNVGQWATAQEIFQAVTWPQGGATLAGNVLDVGTADLVKWDATDLASGANATLAGFFGIFMYSDTIAAPVADQGVSYNYLGGTQTVTGGVATIVWHANGIAAFTL